MASHLASRMTVARGLTSGMARVSAGVQTARAFTGFSQRVVATAGMKHQQRYMSVFKDEYDALAAERANEGLVPRPLDPAQTAALVEMLKVGRGLVSFHPPTLLFLLAYT
jgi:hypothetical protein